MGKNELYSKAAPKPPSAHSDLALDLLQGLSGSSSWTWSAYSQAQQAQCLSSVLPNMVLIQSCSALPVINYYCVARVQGKSAQVSCRQAEELMILLCWNRLNRSEHHHVGSRHSTGKPGDMGVPTWLPSATKWDARYRSVIAGCGLALWRDFFAQHFVSWTTCQLTSSSLQDKLNLPLLISRSLKLHWGLVLCFLQLV